jgi:4-amino-4-deoxy-L-arabinose transferase-like glycosyltransferase
MGRVRERLRFNRFRAGAVGLALVGALVVYFVSTSVFPYHSLNHDEAVYLQQAAMLLDGQLFLRPPVPETFRPWFFVASENGLYPKYAPVTAAMFAVGRLLGGYRIALAGIAAANVFLLAVVVAETFRHEGQHFARAAGLLAGVFLLVSPLFLITSSVFLSYAPTTAWNLLFAAAYLRADRTGNRGLAAVAGLAIGIAFFARPYTAVLFAAPFVGHALWTLGREGRAALPTRALTAAGGMAGVIVALGYNAIVTGNPLVFPYAAFAPLDGIGFGHREILGHGVNYTPTLALRANARVLTALFSDWVVAGALGTALAALGVGSALIVPREGRNARTATLAGLFITVPVGNIAFWGNLNILGNLRTAGDGLIAFLGPYYHFDLLVPVAAFTAYAGLRGALFLRKSARRHLDPRQARVVVAVCLLVASAGLAGVTATEMRQPLDRNLDVTAEYQQAYAPFENRSFENALVFLPILYGNWLNHPFQALRNDPGFDGNVIYALAERQFDVIDAYPNRTYYRYSYEGTWAPTTGDAADAHLRRIEVVGGDRIVLNVRVGVPGSPKSVSVRLAGGSEQTYYTASPSNGSLSLRLVIDERARLAGNVTPVNERAISLNSSQQLTLSVFVDEGATGGFGYRLVLPLDAENARIRALPPTTTVCPAYRCEGVSGSFNVSRPGAFIETSLTATNATGTGHETAAGTVTNETTSERNHDMTTTKF